jgi:hypothetical protein
VNFGYFIDPDTTRYCYLRLRRLKPVIKDDVVVDALMEELEVPAATGKNKMKAIERRIEELRSTKSSLWHEVPAPEILTASIFRAKKLAGAFVDDLFRAVPRVQDLATPRIVGIEATNDASQLDRALDEWKTSRANTHATYIACTPALAATFLWAQATRPGVSRWDAEALQRRLKASGCGLLLVEGDAVVQTVLPREHKLDRSKLVEMATAIRG